MQSNVADPETERWIGRVERYFTEFFQRNAERVEVADLPEREDKLGWWEIMQHYGAPTRLMDWTTSPFIALWFALDDHADGDGDMALWICDRRNAEINHAEAQSKLEGLENYDELNERERLNRFVRFAIEDGNPALIPTQPRLFPRAAAQQSVLTVSPSIGIGRPAHLWIRKKLATQLLIREEWKSDIAAACQSMGLSRQQLFRDLGSLGSYMTRSWVAGAGLENVT